MYVSPSQEADGNFNPLTSDLSLELSFFPSKERRQNFRRVKSLARKREVENDGMNHFSDLLPG